MSPWNPSEDFPTLPDQGFGENMIGLATLSEGFGTSPVPEDNIFDNLSDIDVGVASDGSHTFGTIFEDSDAFLAPNRDVSNNLGDVGMINASNEPYTFETFLNGGQRCPLMINETSMEFENNDEFDENADLWTISESLQQESSEDVFDRAQPLPAPTSQPTHIVQTTNTITPRRTSLTYDLHRPVVVIANAHRIARDSRAAHNVRVQDLMTQFEHRVSAYTCHRMMSVDVPWSETRQLLIMQAFERVNALRLDGIEPRVGRFGHNDTAYIHRLPHVQERLLAVMHIGLLRQEYWGHGYIDADPRTIENVNGSCLLEARRWQLDMLQEWTNQLENAIWDIGGTFP